MNAKFSGTIVFVSAFYNRTGLAVAARAWAKALYDSGINIRIVSVNDVQPGIDDCDLGLLKTLEKTTIIPPITAVFFHNPSEGWLNTQLPTPHLRMLLTGFVGENVPDDWVDICNRMDRLCVMSEAEKNAWAASGVDPNLLQVLPGVHPWQFLPIIPVNGASRTRANGRFRFLSLGTFSPNRRWDALIQAYLEEFKDNDQVELYLRVNYPNWHPIPGQPKRDLSNLIEDLRKKSLSDAKIVVDEDLGTRLDIMRLMDSCDVYVSTDVSIAAPVSEAIFRQKVVVAADVYNSGDAFFLPPHGAIFIPPGDNGETIVVQGEMLPYLPQYRGVSWPKLDVGAIRQSLRDAYCLSPDERLEMIKTADRHFRANRNRLVPSMVKTIKTAWTYKEDVVAFKDNDLQLMVHAINHCRKQQRVEEALQVCNQALQLAPRHIEVLTLCGLLLLDGDDLQRAETVWKQLPWYTSLTNPDVMAFLEKLIQKGSPTITLPYLIDLAKSAKLEGAWVQAIKLFKTAIDRSESDASTAFLLQDLAGCYQHLGDENNERETLETAYNRAPNNVNILKALAELYLRRKQYDQANWLIKEGLGKSPDDAELLILRGNCAIGQNDFDRAFDTLQQVSIVAPQTLALEVALEHLGAITGKKPISIKRDADRGPQEEVGSSYTRDIMADSIARYGFEIGEFTYGTPIIRWWGENARLKIGRYCSIAGNVKIYLGGNYRHTWVATYPFPSSPMNQDWSNANHRGLAVLPATKGDVIIGSDVWIGDDAVILSGVTVGHGAVIAARTVVTKNVPPFAIVGGNPGTIISYRFPEEEIQMLLALSWWDWDPSKVNDFMPYLCAEDVTGFHDAVKKAGVKGDGFPQPSPESELFTGERAMPLASNMLPQVMQEHWARYRYAVPVVKGKRVLDVACGAGYGSDLLAETAQRVLGGDISPETVAYSQKYYRRDNLTFEVMDVRDIPYPDRSFDVVVSFETIEHIVEGEQFLREVVRLLDDDGVLIISTPLGGPVGNPYHVAYYQRGTFAPYLRNFFGEVKLLYQRDEIIGETGNSPEYAPTFTGEYAVAICKKPKPRVAGSTSIIITGSAANSDMFSRCIENIQLFTATPHEIIVVDSCINGSVKKSLPRDGKASYRLIPSGHDANSVACINRALSAARGEFVALLDIDAMVTEGWLTQMLDVLKSHPEAGLVVPLSNGVSGSQLAKDVSYFNLESMHEQAVLQANLHQGQMIETSHIAAGCCLLTRRALIDRLGGLDRSLIERWISYTDLAVRAAISGFKTLVAQDAFVHHGDRLTSIARENRVEFPDEKWSHFRTKWNIPADAQLDDNKIIHLQTEDPSKFYIPLPSPRISFEHSVIPNMTSLVILTFNELKYTKECVAGLKKHTGVPYEIIFVDNGSTDGTVKWLRQLVQKRSNYKLIENQENLGYAKGCNQGIEASRGEFILLLNNDVVVAQGWLSGMLEALASAPNAGIVGPMTNNISGPQQVVADAYQSVDDLDTYAAQFREKYRHRRISQRRIVGFCMLFKRALAEEIGLLDESFGTGNFEDDDFCLRATLAGYKNYIAGDVFIHHYGSRSFIGNKINYSTAMSDNRKIIEQKWSLKVQSPDGKRLAVLKATEHAHNLYMKGEEDQAVRVLIDCIKITPEAEEIYYELARIFLESKQFAEAFAVVEQMPEAAKNGLKGLQYAGYSKEGLGLDDEADMYADRMLSINNKYPAALILKGILAYKEGDKEKAVNYFKKAIDADPGCGETYSYLGIIYWGMGQKDEARAFLQKGFVLSPTAPDTGSLYYSAVSSLGIFGNAEADFREASLLHPNNKNLSFLFQEVSRCS